MTALQSAVLAMASLVLLSGSACSSASGDALPKRAYLEDLGPFETIEAGETLGGLVADEPRYILYGGGVSFADVAAKLRDIYRSEGWREYAANGRGAPESVGFSRPDRKRCVSYSNMAVSDAFIPLPLSSSTVQEALRQHPAVVLMVISHCVR